MPRRPGDGVHDDVELPAGRIAQLAAQPDLVVAEVERGPPLGLAPDDADGPGRAKQPRDLAELRAQPARRSVHQHVLAGLQMGDALERDERRRRIRGDRRGQRRIHARRQGRDQIGVRDRDLAVSAAAIDRQRDDGVAWLKG